MNIQDVTIVEYSPQYAKDFAQLNYHWIEEFFTIEECDRLILDNPEQRILDQGGQIFFAIRNNEALGTVALIPKGDSAFELAKMAVSPQCKGKKLGKRLMLRAIDFALQKEKEKLIIYSNTLLVPAIHLYIQYGFIPVPQEPDTIYERCNIKMEKKL